MSNIDTLCFKIPGQLTNQRAIESAMQTSVIQNKRLAASDFRTYLQQELLERCRKNPKYSLRAFARSLGVEPSALSQILNGKRPLTEKMKMRLGTALGISTERLNRLPTNRNESDPQKRLQQITLDQFAIIADWYHYAILELTYVVGFKPSTAWIARRLGITKSEVNIAVERLFRLGLLEKKGASWVDASENGELTHIHPDLTSTAAKKYQCQLLDLSKNAVQSVDVKRRNHTSATLCFDVADMDAAIDRIKEFRRDFAQEFQPRKRARDVYQLQISFYPLTNQQEPKDT